MGARQICGSADFQSVLNFYILHKFLEHELTAAVAQICSAGRLAGADKLLVESFLCEQERA